MARASLLILLSLCVPGAGAFTWNPESVQPGDVFVGEEGSTISWYRPEGLGYRWLGFLDPGVGGDRVVDLAFGPTGVLYAAVSTWPPYGRVDRYDDTGAYLGSSSTTRYPQGIDVGIDGTVYVGLRSDPGDGIGIDTFDADGSFLRNLPPGQGGSFVTLGIDGCSLYHHSGGDIYRRDICVRGSPDEIFAPHEPGFWPADLETTPSGGILAGSIFDGRVYHFHGAGAVDRIETGAPPRDAMSVASDVEGDNFYVQGPLGDDLVRRVSAGYGGTNRIFGTSFGAPASVTVFLGPTGTSPPVPELATSVLVGMGLVVAVLVARRVP